MPEDLVEAPAADPVPDDASPASPTTPAPGDGSAWDRWREHRRNRPSRWDRPPPPKDWRYFVGTLGKVLIAAGLLMFGFVAYQLWGTGIETARAQNRLENTFEEQFEAALAERDADAAADVVAGDGAGDPTATDDDTAIDTDDDTDGSGGSGEPSAAPGVGGAMSDVVPGGIDLSDDAVEQDVPVVPGEAFARLDVPSIGISELYVVPGVTLDDLKKGPGHYPDTPLPGQLGNAAIAGHRTTYGAPFFDLDQLELDDEIVVTMVTGDRFVYRVTGSEIVSATDYWVITTRDPNVAELTLTTCDPKYTARDRLIVHSVLVPEHSSQVGLAELYDLESDDVDGAAEEIPGDDPTVTVPTEDGSTSATGSTVAPDETTTSDADTDDAAPVEPAAPAGDESTTPIVPDPIDPGDAELDAFSEGWFHDGAAWPQIALWAGVLTLIAVLAYQLAKKTRHSSIGVLVGILPFIVALYFFYQNVNRLLPPGL